MQGEKCARNVQCVHQISSNPCILKGLKCHQGKEGQFSSYLHYPVPLQTGLGHKFTQFTGSNGVEGKRRLWDKEPSFSALKIMYFTVSNTLGYSLPLPVLHVGSGMLQPGTWGQARGSFSSVWRGEKREPTACGVSSGRALLGGFTAGFAGPAM